MKPTSRPDDETASANITRRIQELGDWRGETLAHIRQLIHECRPRYQGRVEMEGSSPSGPTTAAFAPANRTSRS